MLEKSNPSDSHPVVLTPCPSGNAGDHHSILSISIFACHLFPSLSIWHTQTGEAPPGAPLNRKRSVLAERAN